jgi:murein DD-endopeptidase MepM/ murein hydrolase activator NlpD
MEVGRPVRAGEVVGLVGDTGVKASGPHLHFTIIDPAPRPTTPSATSIPSP